MRSTTCGPPRITSCWTSWFMVIGSPLTVATTAFGCATLARAGGSFLAGAAGLGGTGWAAGAPGAGVGGAAVGGVCGAACVAAAGVTGAFGLAGAFVSAALTPTWRANAARGNHFFMDENPFLQESIG